MAKPKDRIYVEHILEAIALIEGFVAGKTLDDFQRVPMLNSAVIRQLEIIGEAAKRLSEDFKSERTHLPWRRITGMRDFLIHDYLEIDLEIVWRTATEDIEELKLALQAI
jgi:uncharacterized protein with HEPN domain